MLSMIKLANIVLTVIMKMSFLIVKLNHCEIEVEVHSLNGDVEGRNTFYNILYL